MHSEVGLAKFESAIGDETGEEIGDARSTKRQLQSITKMTGRFLIDSIAIFCTIDLQGIMCVTRRDDTYKVGVAVPSATSSGSAKALTAATTFSSLHWHRSKEAHSYAHDVT